MSNNQRAQSIQRISEGISPSSPLRKLHAIEPTSLRAAPTIQAVATSSVLNECQKWAVRISLCDEFISLSGQLWAGSSFEALGLELPVALRPSPSLVVSNSPTSGSGIVAVSVKSREHPVVSWPSRPVVPVEQWFSKFLRSRTT